MSSGRQFFFFFFWFYVVALWSVVTLWCMDLRKSALLSFGINLFFNSKILILLYLTTEFFVFLPKSSNKISNILESASKSAQVPRNQRIWEHWCTPLFVIRQEFLLTFVHLPSTWRTSMNGEQTWPNVFVHVCCKLHTWGMHMFACLAKHIR